MLGTKRIAVGLRGPWARAVGSPAAWSGLLLLSLLAGPAAAQRLPLPPNEQEAVNRAIERGANFLKATQPLTGTWTTKKEHAVGYAVLPGLTLLECGVPPGDPVIQRAARFLRANAAQLDTTYELSLGILFLDRLGEAKDRKIIQTFALRLIAGQSMTGGWGYKCPVLNHAAHMDLMTALRHLDPPEPMQGVAGGRPADLQGVAGGTGSPPGFTTNTPGGSASSTSGPTGRLGKELQPAPPEPPDGKPVRKELADGKPAKPFVLPKRVRGLPVVVDPERHILEDPKDKAHDLILATTDNSNTQFAILALWVARRHEVPTRRSLNLIVRRFVTSQNGDGSWGYFYRNGGGDPERPAMTCAGLIGLAVGHGLAARKDGQPVKDPRVLNGLVALSKHVGRPADRLNNLPMANLYFLWSLERVAVLYNLGKIGDKDWYRWGAQVLVANQEPPGNWNNGQYHGSSPILDTSLALLYLKRANLAMDLTSRLPFQPTDLNNSVVEKLAPPPKPPEPIRKPTQPAAPDNLITKPTQPAETDNLIAKPLNASVAGSLPDETAGVASAGGETGGVKKWVALGVALVVLLAGGGALLFLFLFNRHKDDRDDEKPPPSRSHRPRSKLHPAN